MGGVAEKLPLTDRLYPTLSPSARYHVALANDTWFPGAKHAPAWGEKETTECKPGSLDVLWR